MARDPFESRPNEAYARLAGVLSGAEPTGAPPLKRAFGKIERKVETKAPGKKPKRATSQGVFVIPPQRPDAGAQASPDGQDGMPGYQLAGPDDALPVPPRGRPAPSAGIEALDLTPQEQNLYQHHLDNLRLGLEVENPPPSQGGTGGTSTVLQRVVPGPGGQFYSIPSVWDGKELSEGQARDRAEAEGWDKWPAYATPDEADARYMQMHDFMARDIGDDRQEGRPKMVPPSRPAYAGLARALLGSDPTAPAWSGVIPDWYLYAKEGRIPLS